MCWCVLRACNKITVSIADAIYYNWTIETKIKSKLIHRLRRSSVVKCWSANDSGLDSDKQLQYVTVLAP